MIKYSMEFCESLTLYTSESCNLQCSYCDMNNHLNKQQHALEAKKVKDSLVNGEYLNTLNIAFEKLNINPHKIKTINLWGQEPTLTLKNFEIMFYNLYKNLCPNINKIFFSTNGVSCTDDIIHFIEYIDQNVLDKSCLLTIQFSYDGYTQTKKHRGIDSKIIINNIYKILNKLNKINFNFLTIDMQLHNVLDQETFTFFSKEENLELLQQFLLEFENIYHNLKITNLNKNINIFPFWTAIENPLNGSVKDGQMLFSFVEQCNKICKNPKFNMGTQIAEYYAKKMPLYREDKIIALLNEINCSYYINDFDNLQTLKYLSNKMGCGYNSATLKIRYDGTLMHCQNALYSLHPLNENNLDNKIQKQKKDKYFYPNIITDNDDIINNYLYQTFIKNSECFLPAYIQTCQFLALLLNSNQINNKYNNLNDFMKCAFFLTYLIPCPHASMMYCGNAYGIYCGFIRLFCNGFMDYIFNKYQERLERINE